MSDVQFGLLTLAVVTIAIAGFFFGRRFHLHTPIVSIGTNEEQKQKPKRKQPRQVKRKKTVLAKQPQKLAS
jgi:hypothetical protein